MDWTGIKTPGSFVPLSNPKRLPNSQTRMARKLPLASLVFTVILFCSVATKNTLSIPTLFHSHLPAQHLLIPSRDAHVIKGVNETPCLTRLMRTERAPSCHLLFPPANSGHPTSFSRP